MTEATLRKIHGIIDEVVTEKGADWAEISNAVDKKMTITDWMEIRGVIGWMMNEKMIERTDDLNKEIYVRLG